MRDSSGNNTVRCTDARGTVVVAQITQPVSASTLKIDKGSGAIRTSGGSLILTAGGGSGSYVWTTTLGVVSPMTGSSTVLTLGPGTGEAVVGLNDGTTTVFDTISRN